MRCTQVSELMSLSLDGLATPDDSIRLNAHLAECDECRLAWSALQEVSRLFEAGEWLEPPAGFTEQVMARVQTRWAPWRVGGAVLLLAAGALAGILAMLPVLTLIASAWQAASRASVVAAGVHAVSTAASAGRALLSAVLLLAEAAVQAVPAPLLVLYPIVAMLLALVWVVALSQVQARATA